MKTLVTGGSGFIGSNLTKFLCDQGHQVTILDDLSSGYISLVDKRARFVKGQIQNRPLLEKILPGIEVVFHLAATSTTTFSLTAPEKYFENNFMNGIPLLEAMRNTGVKKIVYSSSASSYGKSSDKFLKEEDVVEPISPYGASKLMFEHVLSSYYHAFGISGTALRYFNVYGPNDEQLGTRAVPKWVKAALQNKPLTLYWSGKQKRDYIFVEDIARVNVAAALHCHGFNVYNVGSGKGVWMSDIIKKLEKIFAKKLVIKHLGRRMGDPKFAIANISKIKKELRWQPRISLDRGLEMTVDYFKNKFKII